MVLVNRFLTDNWADEIAELTELRAYQSADIRIWDPAAEEPEYDANTGRYTDVGRPRYIYEGQARVIGVRWGNDRTNTQISNPSTTSSVRVQIPQAALPVNIVRGTLVGVVGAPHNPSLVGKVFVITSDFQGGSAATRSFEAELNGDFLAGP